MFMSMSGVGLVVELVESRMLMLMLILTVAQPTVYLESTYLPTVLKPDDKGPTYA